MKLIYIAFILLFHIPLFTKEPYSSHPEISYEERKLLAKYTMPASHPLNPLMKALFSEPGVCEDDEALASHGFALLSVQQASFVRIAEHPAFPGYLFKIYTDAEERKKDNVPGWRWLLNRCIGAENIRKFIPKHKIINFVVPDKWLYPLPVDPLKDPSIQQPVVLIVTKMDLLPRDENKQAWLSANKKVIDELFDILSHGYGSYFLTGNIPATRSGKFAFIDTEYPKRQIRMKKVRPFLSPEMQLYWDKLNAE